MKSGKELSVWTWPNSKSYYLTHPWMWVRELFINIRNGWKRTKYGYCSSDWYNFDQWFLIIAPRMLHDIADHGLGYPGVEPFETPEKWHKWLEKMADQLMWCSETDEALQNGIFRNEYAEAYDKMIGSKMDKLNIKDKEYPWNSDKTPEEKELSKKYLDRVIEINREREALIKSTLNELSEHWFSIWD